jgi:hypothetical protein
LFGYDTNFEVVTKDHQKFLLASSGVDDLNRPDKYRSTRSGGFAYVEMVFDGKMLTLLRRGLNGGHFESVHPTVVWRFK